MSANNYIRIKKVINKGSPRFIVEDMDADTNKPHCKVGARGDLEAAVAAANEYMKENEVEYGLNIQL